MLQKILKILAILLLIAACYFGYVWYISEPDNKEPLPALLSIGSSLIALIAAWISNRSSSATSNNVDVRKTDDATVDIDPNEKTNYKVSKIKKSKIFIGKGKASLQKDQDTDTPS